VYRCRQQQHLSRRQDLVDLVIVDSLIERLSRADSIPTFSLDTEGDARLATRADDIRLRLDQLAELLADGSLPAAAVRRASAGLRADLADVEAQRLALAVSPEVAALAAATDVRSTWVAMSLSARRRVVDAFLTATILPVVRGARFDPSQVKIEWTMPA
jgi:voltage-gated potassium channel Kch